MKNMFSYLKECFFTSSYEYVLMYPKEQLVERLDHYFKDTKRFYAPVNMTGRFIDGTDTFKVNAKWSIVFIRGFSSDLAYLKGEIADQTPNQTRLKISTNSNIIFLLLFLISITLGFYFIYQGISSGEDESNWVGAFFTLLLFAPLMPVAAKKSKNNLKERFTKYFHIY